MIDISKLINETIFTKFQNELVCENGAQGHMKHLFDDGRLAFSEIRDILKKVFTGKIQVEEKVDGQALACTYKDGKVMVARNKASLRDPMDISKLSSMFDGRGEVKEAFVKSMTAITKALKSLDKQKLDDIFNNGHKFMAFEIIYPPTKNVIDYGDKCILILHGINVYDEKFNLISQDKAAADDVYKLLKEKGALNEDDFEIQPPQILKLKNSKNAEESLEDLMEDMRNMMDGLSWSDTIEDYVLEQYKRHIINTANDMGLELERNSDLVEELAKRLCYTSSKHPTKADLNTYAKKSGIDTRSEEYSRFFEQLQSTQDEMNQKFISKVELFIIKAGVLLMQNLQGFLAVNPAESSKKLAAELQAAIDQFKDGDLLSPEKMKIFNKNIEKLEKFKEKVIPAEGIVFLYKGKPYKMTGEFGAVNQILGITKYGK